MSWASGTTRQVQLSNKVETWDKAVVVQRQVPHATDDAHVSEPQQSQSIGEIIDITVSVQRQKSSKSKTLSANQKDSKVKGFRRSWRFSRSEDHGGSPDWWIQKNRGDSSVFSTVKMVDGAAKSSEDSADATGPVSSLRSWLRSR